MKEAIMSTPMLRVALIACATLASVSGRTEAASTGESKAAPIDTSNAQVQAEAHALAEKPPVLPPKGHRIVDDHSGRKQTGKASVYSGHFQGQRMANGQRFDHRGNAAASKSLPLGTVAKVTNVDNGRTSVVTVEDRGPYVDGRTLDVTHSTAEQLGITDQAGLAPVVVAPIAVPQPDGTVKPGAGALPGPATAR
jgi:rare lipoprotein A